MNPLCWVAAFCALALPLPAAARPFTIEDLLRLEMPGEVTVDPTGRWLLYDAQRPYIDAPRFDAGGSLRSLNSQILRVDLLHPARAVPAFAENPRGGYIPGPFSPDGRYVTIFRNLDRRWELGVLTIATRQVRWLGFGVDLADRGETLAWRSPTHLVALRLPLGDRGWHEEGSVTAMEQLPDLWAKARRGREATETLVGSRRYLATRPAARRRAIVDVDAGTGAVRVYGTGAFERLSLSPRGGRLALVETTGREEISGEHLIAAGTPLLRHALKMLDLKTGVLAVPCAEDPLPSSLRWSPMSEELLVYSRPLGSNDWALGAYHRIDPAEACLTLESGGLTAKASIEPESGFVRSHIEWLDGDPMVLAARAGEDRKDWYRLTKAGPVKLTATLTNGASDPILIGRDHAVFRDGGALFSIDRTGSASRLAARGLSRVLAPTLTYGTGPTVADGAPRVQKLFATADVGDATKVWRLTETDATEVGSAPKRPLTYYTGTDFGVVRLSTDAHGVSTLDLIRNGSAPVRLADANLQQALIDIAPAIPVTHTGPEGQALTSWLYMPKLRPGVKPPLLVMAYPGFAPSTPPWYGVPGNLAITIDDNPQLAVGHGYAVLSAAILPPAGSAAPGLSFAGQLDHILVEVAKTGLVDTSRLGFWGHSYGGYAALMLASETDRFKAIVAATPCSDLMSVRALASPSLWLTSDVQEANLIFAGWSELGQGHLMALPWVDPSRYTENSPVYRADLIHTPVLILQGEQDVMGIMQGREMYAALDRLGRDVLFATFYGEGHGVSGPANMRAYADTVFGFLDPYLMPDPGTAGARTTLNASPTPSGLPISGPRLRSPP